MKWITRLAGACAAALVLAVPFASAADATNTDDSAAKLSADLLFPNPVVARGKGFEIRQNDVDDAITGLRATLAAQGQTLPESQRGDAEARTLDRMILSRILLQKATPEEKAKAKESADKFIAETKKRAPSEESYRRQLIAVGIKPEVFEKRAFEQAVVETVVNHEIRDKLTIAPDEIKAYYDQGVDVLVRDLQALLEKMQQDGQTNTAFYSDGTNRLAAMKQANLARLDRPETVRASLIILYTIDVVTRTPLPAEVQADKKARIEKILARLKNGEDFAKVARESSEDPDVMRSSGEYTTTRDNVAIPELKAALFSLPIGQVSDIITTPIGFYLVKVAERNAAGKIPFDKAESDIRNLLLSQEVEKRLPAYYAQLKKEYDVQIVPPNAANP